MGCEIFQPEDNEPFVRKQKLSSIKDVNGFIIPPPEENPVLLYLLNKAKKFYELTEIKDKIGRAHV